MTVAIIQVAKPNYEKCSRKVGLHYCTIKLEITIISLICDGSCTETCQHIILQTKVCQKKWVVNTPKYLFTFAGMAHKSLMILLKQELETKFPICDASASFRHPRLGGCQHFTLTFKSLKYRKVGSINMSYLKTLFTAVYVGRLDVCLLWP